jgi:DNA replication protein DnaC
MEQYKLLKDQLKILKLDAINEVFASKAAEYRKSSLDYIDYLGELIKNQVERKIERSVNYRFREAKLPWIKTYEQYETDYPKKFDKKIYESLLDLSFVDRKENILFIGPPGVGKTHLAIAIAVRACQERIRTIFLTASDFIEQLNFAKLNHYLVKYIEKLSSNSLLIIDELGYNNISAEDASIFFKLISKKYEKTSVIITSNKPFNEWGKMFNDEVLASAILDRLIHHSQVLKIIGNSYRCKNKNIDFKNDKDIINERGQN